MNRRDRLIAAHAFADRRWLRACAAPCLTGNGRGTCDDVASAITCATCRRAGQWRAMAHRIEDALAADRRVDQFLRDVGPIAELFAPAVDVFARSDRGSDQRSAARIRPNLSLDRP